MTEHARWTTAVFVAVLAAVVAAAESARVLRRSELRFTAVCECAALRDVSGIERARANLHRAATRHYRWWWRSACRHQSRHCRTARAAQARGRHAAAPPRRARRAVARAARPRSSRPVPRRCSLSHESHTHICVSASRWVSESGRGHGDSVIGNRTQVEHVEVGEVLVGLGEAAEQHELVRSSQRRGAERALGRQQARPSQLLPATEHAAISMR